MTASLSTPPAFETGEPNRPTVPWWRRALGALLFAAASAATAVAALTVVFSLIDLVNGNEHGILSPGALAAGAAVAALALLGVWALLGWVLRRLGSNGDIRSTSALVASAFVVPVGYALVRAATRGPVETLWWPVALAAFSGVVVFAVATGIRRPRIAATAAAALALAVLAGGVAAQTEVERAELRAEFDRHSAIPVLRHPDWKLAHVTPRPEDGEVTVEYRNTKSAEAAPLALHAYRPEETDWQRRGTDAGAPADYEDTEHDGVVLAAHPDHGASLYLGLDVRTEVQAVWQGEGTEEELVGLAGYVGAATDAERDELRSVIGRAPSDP